MHEKKDKSNISKYIKIYFTTILVISAITALIVVITGELTINKTEIGFLTIVSSIEKVLNLFFTMFPYAFSTIIAIVALDIQDYENLGSSYSEYHLFGKLANHDSSAKWEVRLSAITISLFLLVGMVNKWTSEVYREEFSVPTFIIVIILVIAIISLLIWFNLRFRRNCGRKRKTQKDISIDMYNIKSGKKNSDVIEIASNIEAYYIEREYAEEDLFYRIDKLDTYSLFKDSYFNILLGILITSIIGDFTFLKPLDISFSGIFLVVILLYALIILIRTASSAENGREKYLDDKEKEIIINTIENHKNSEVHS